MVDWGCVLPSSMVDEVLPSSEEEVLPSSEGEDAVLPSELILLVGVSVNDRFGIQQTNVDRAGHQRRNKNSKSCGSQRVHNLPNPNKITACVLKKFAYSPRFPS